MKIPVILVATFLWQSSAKVIFRRLSEIGTIPSVNNFNPPPKYAASETTGSQIVPRDDNQEVCRPPSRPLSGAKRSISNAPTTVYNEVLWRRAMLVPGVGEEEAFIMTQTDSKDTYPIWWGVDNPREPGKPITQYDVNTALFRKYENIPISLSTYDLHGCSALAIVSRHGVYMTHYWESIAYSPTKKDMAQEKTDQAGMFEKYVLTGLRNGSKGPKITEQVSLRDNAQILDDDYTYAFLIHPAPNPSNRNGYEEEAQKIRAVVEELLPKIKTSGRFTLVPYNVQPRKAIRMKTSAGRALFLYEPIEAVPPRRGYTTAKIMLWSETTVVHQDQ